MKRNKSVTLLYAISKPQWAINVSSKSREELGETCYRDMLSKWKLKNSTKNLSTTLQVEIDPLVNKLEYTNIKKSLIYTMYLSPPSSCYQWTSRNLVFTSFPDPAISPDCISHLMASSNASQRHQNFSQHLEWVR